VPVPVSDDVVGVLAAVLANEADADAPPVAPGLNVTVNVTGWVVETVTGNESPLTENSEALLPLRLTEVTDTLAPVALSVPVCDPLVPTTTLPALTALTANVPGLCDTAVPLSPMLKAGLVAFELTRTLPLELVVDCGAKVTLNEVLCPGVRVNGVVMPEMLKPVPPTVACETVAFMPPVLVTVSVCASFCPTVTLVNVRLEGVAVNVAGVTPVPDRATSSVVLDPVTVIERFPLAAPAVVGLKTTPNVVL